MASTSYDLQPHILVVDDDQRIRDLLGRYLLEHGFVPVLAADAREARELLELAEVDCAVLDVMMPGETGIELAQDLRKRYGMPMLMLSALGEVEDRVAGFEAGVDDYLPKPFEPQELVLRLQALLRRTMVQKTQVKRLAIGDKVFDLHAGILRDVQNNVIALTDAERELLLALARHMGETVERDALAEHSGAGSLRAVDVQMTRLRRKIENDEGAPQFLQTVRGKGYILRGAYRIEEASI